MELTKKAKALLKLGLCDHCLGRQFAQLGHGLENFERGLIIRTALKGKKKIKEKLFKRENIPNLEVKKNCFLCRDYFEKIEYFAEFISIGLKKYDFETFLIGCKIPLELKRKEEELWETYGFEETEPMKSEINRLIGKKVSTLIKKRVDFKRPHINAVINLEKEHLNLYINSIFIFGKYNKLERGIAQTRTYCPICKGRGCSKCNWEGRLYKESVQELLAKKFLKFTKGTDTKFHGCGREDVDARCFGKRPFVMEILEPEIRKINLKKLQKEINKKNKGRVKIFNLRFSNKNEIRKLKEAKPDKVYRIILKLEKKISRNELKKLDKLVGVIKQRTPIRVEKRRANLIRKRKLKSISWKKLSNNKLRLTLKTEAGFYVKEFITGDEGRTKPNVSEVLNQKVEWENLDVLKVLYP